MNAEVLKYPIYELVNPSDTYTLRAREQRVAVHAALQLGGGFYALRGAADEEVMPIFLSTESLEDWLSQTYQATTTEFMAGIDWRELADVLESLVCVPVRYRELYDRALLGMKGEERINFETEWHEKHTTSMNNIGARAKRMAAIARAKVASE